MSEETTIRPALTPEEWATTIFPNHYGMEVGVDVSAHIASGGRLVVAVGPDAFTAAVDRPHALAALALHGQPFGFTVQHLADLMAAATVRSLAPADVALSARLLNLHARIAALLPPR